MKIIGSAIAVIILAGAWGILHGSRVQATAELDDLIGAIETLDRFPQPDILIPSVDLRLEILNRNPGLFQRAEALLAEWGGSPRTTGEFHILFDYYYFVDIEKLIQLVLHAPDARTAIEHIDFAFLLPGYLYERMGLMELARIHYARYYRMIKQLSVNHDLTASSSYQKRLTFVRYKLQFLKSELPGLLGGFYEASYFSALLSDFFEITLNTRSYLSKYRDAGLLRTPPLELESIEFDPTPLREIVRFDDVITHPFAHFELCASFLRPTAPIPEDGFHKLNTLIYSQSQGSFLHATALFVKGRLLMRRGDYAEARGCFERIEQTGSPQAEFLRDDALFFEHLCFMKEGLLDEAMLPLRVLGTNYPDDSYDFALRARGVLDPIAGRDK